MIDSKLQKLRDNISYYEWKFESCHRFWKNEYLTEIRKARAKLKEYKAKHYPEMLTPLLTQPKPFTPRPIEVDPRSVDEIIRERIQIKNNSRGLAALVGKKII